MAKGGGRRTGNSSSRRSRGSSGGAARAVKNVDGTVTLATRGKLASKGKGSGAQHRAPLAASGPKGGAYVQKQKGVGPINPNAKV